MLSLSLSLGFNWLTCVMVDLVNVRRGRERERETGGRESGNVWFQKYRIILYTYLWKRLGNIESWKHFTLYFVYHLNGIFIYVYYK